MTGALAAAGEPGAARLFFWGGGGALGQRAAGYPQGTSGGAGRRGQAAWLASQGATPRSAAWGPGRPESMACGARADRAATAPPALQSSTWPRHESRRIPRGAPKQPGQTDDGSGTAPKSRNSPWERPGRSVGAAAEIARARAPAKLRRLSRLAGSVGPFPPAFSLLGLNGLCWALMGAFGQRAAAGRPIRRRLCFWLISL